MVMMEFLKCNREQITITNHLELATLDFYDYRKHHNDIELRILYRQDSSLIYFAC